LVGDFPNETNYYTKKSIKFKVQVRKNALLINDQLEKPFLMYEKYIDFNFPHFYNTNTCADRKGTSKYKRYFLRL
jgi:hypothetical protein